MKFTLFHLTGGKKGICQKNRFNELSSIIDYGNTRCIKHKFFFLEVMVPLIYYHLDVYLS